MPQTFKPYRQQENDGRVKIKRIDRPKVRTYYKQVKSQRKTAEYFNVSRRTIQWVLNPIKYQDALYMRRQRKTHKIYYDKDRHRKAVQKYRTKKRILKLYATTL